MSKNHIDGENRRAMDLPTTHDECENCGLWGYEHDKKKVYKNGGNWYWEYYCPIDESETELVGLQ